MGKNSAACSADGGFVAPVRQTLIDKTVPVVRQSVVNRGYRFQSRFNRCILVENGVLRKTVPRNFNKFSFDKQYALTGHWRQWEPTASNPYAMELCQHPRVRVLTHEKDAEFVECLECGEVFDSHEFTDMAIEEKDLKNAEQDDE
ncbi:MAG: hypothetical protein ABI076_09395 [Acidobacteriaceae bacterium]